MGFLLSKLLPLALYPLGLGLLLQLAGQLGLVWLFAMPLTSRQLVWGLEEQAAALTPAVIPKADAILVLGGGLRPALAPRRGVEVGEGGDRLLTGVRLLRQGKAPLLFSAAAGWASPPTTRPLRRRFRLGSSPWSWGCRPGAS